MTSLRVSNNNFISSPLFHVIDHNSSIFFSFVIKLGKKASGINIMVPGCDQLIITTMVGIRKKKSTENTYGFSQNGIDICVDRIEII